ncbi:hypothetical protein IAU60_003786 [Kwoniella sp. DSM 27419]
MTPKLRVLIPAKGGKGYPPTRPCPVNSDQPTPLVTDGFEGDIWVFVKGYNGDHKEGEGEKYFNGRDGISYGIVVKGKFKKDLSAEEVVFGNVFEKPIRDNLPWGTSIATKFMYFVDPTVEADIYADKPWALSPALATMSHLSLNEGENGGSEVYVQEDSVEWLNERGADIGPAADEKAQAAARRKWLGKKDNREKITISKDTAVGLEFCNGLLDFNTLSATLPPPFSLSIPLLKYWDGQPVTYSCQSKPASGNTVGAPAEVYFSVAFEIVDEEARKALEKKGGKPQGHTDSAEAKGGDSANDKAAPTEAEAEAESDDVD